MARELQRRHSSRLHENDEGDGCPGEQQSLRFQQVSPQASNQNHPQFDWSATPEDEDGNGGLKRDLKSICLPMSQRKALREVQQMRLPVVSRFQSWKGRRTKPLHKVKNSCKQFLYLFSLWRRSLQMIGGNFGGGVLSYFVFLRFLVVLNFVSFFLIAGLVLAPSIVFRSVETNSIDPDMFPVNISLEYSSNGANDTEQCEKYDPPGTKVFYQYLLDFFSGTGFMEYSYLFYGYYSSTVVDNSNFSYNIPLAYILTSVFYFTFCLICIIARMGTAARVAVATGGSSGVGTYSMIVFTGWDYGCLGDRATKLKQKNILYQLQVDLEEQRLKKHKDNLSTSQKVLLYSLRVFMFILSLGLIGGALFGIFVATDFSQKSVKQGILGLIIQYLPSIVITTGNFVVPLLCDQIAVIEKYSPSTTVIVALLRAVFLRLVSLGVLLFTLWSGITCNGDETNQDCHLCQYNYTAFPCWETRVGQEMYKLTLFDLLITVAVLLLVEFPRRFVVDKCSCKPVQWVGRQEFVVPSNVLGLVYGQTVVWAGALFCPLLPAINTLKFVILFYCKKITLFQNCRPALKTFRSTTSNFFFLVVLLFGWGLATVVMIYSLSEIHPSYGCGPFRFSPTMWSIVPKSFYGLSEVTQEFLFFIGSQAFSIPLFALSVVVMCYVIALTTVYGRSVALLKAQLKLEGRDKQFLIKQIESLSRQPHVPTHAGVQD